MFGVLGISLSGIGNSIINAIVSMISAVASTLFSGMWAVLTGTSAANLSTGWWSASGGGADLYKMMVEMSVGVMALFFVIALVIAAVKAQPKLAVLAVRELFICVIATGVVVSLTQAFVAVVQVWSNDLIHQFSGGTATLTAGLAAMFAAMGPGALVVAGLMVVAIVAVWLELVGRAVLLYLLIFLAPLVFAARVFTISIGSHHVTKKWIEMWLATILAPLGIAVAVAAAGALATGTITSHSDAGDALGSGMGAIALLVLAATSPFLISKLLGFGADAVAAGTSMANGLREAGGGLVAGSAAGAALAGSASPGKTIAAAMTGERGRLQDVSDGNRETGGSVLGHALGISPEGNILQRGAHDLATRRDNLKSGLNKIAPTAVPRVPNVPTPAPVPNASAAASGLGMNDSQFAGLPSTARTEATRHFSNPNSSTMALPPRLAAIAQYDDDPGANHQLATAAVLNESVGNLGNVEPGTVAQASSFVDRTRAADGSFARARPLPSGPPTAVVEHRNRITAPVVAPRPSAVPATPSTPPSVSSDQKV